MKYERFEELPVWQDAIELAVKIFESTAKPEFKHQFRLKDQIESAGIQVTELRGERYPVKGSSRQSEI